MVVKQGSRKTKGVAYVEVNYTYLIALTDRITS